MLKQKTKVEWELIVVDNNSKDDTKKLVMKYKKKFKKFRSKKKRNPVYSTMEMAAKMEKRIMAVF
jgi:glycosyltransferase involved in cell wall biosynthesis